ncbi:MAG TPA: hypothetical protein VIS74_01500 [Chthoniobacterales bacterium]
MTRDAISCLGLCAAIFAALILQEFIPPLAGMEDARVVLAPMVVCYAALALPFPFMLVAVFWAGFSLDFMNLQWVDGKPEIAPGATIFYFLGVGLLCQGLRVLFLRGYWWLFSLMSGLATSLLLLLQFVFISYRRFETGGIEWSTLVLWRIGLPGLIAFLIAPIFHLLAYLTGRSLLPAVTRSRVFG